MKRYRLYSLLQHMFVLLILPLIVTGLCMVSYSVRINETNIADNFTLALELQANTLEENVMKVQSDIRELMHNSNRFMYTVYTYTAEMPAYVWYSALSNLCRVFQHVVGLSDCVDEIILYYPRQGVLLSSQMGISVLDEEEYDKIRQGFTEKKSVLVKTDDEVFMGWAYPYASLYNRGTEPDYIIIAKLSSDWIEKLIISGAYGDCPCAIFGDESVLIHIGITENDISNDTANAVQLNGKHYAPFYRNCPQINCVMVKYRPRPLVLSSYYWLFACMAGYILLICIVFLVYRFFVRKIVHRPVKKMQEAFQKLSLGDMNVRLQNMDNNLDFEELFASFNEMASTLEKTVDQVYRQRIISTDMELKQLQEQINPHFLYNAFFILRHRLQAGDTKTAALLAGYLGDYFKYITRNARNEVSIWEEYRHCMDFLQIQKIRFGEKLELNVEGLPEAVSGMTVPRLILQPLVENVFSHGRRTDDLINVFSLHFTYDEAFCRVFIEDNGNQLTDETLAEMQQRLCNGENNRETTGVINIHRRLKLYFGEEAGLTLERSPLGGMLVCVCLPCKRQIESGEQHGNLSGSDRGR